LGWSDRYLRGRTRSIEERKYNRAKYRATSEWRVHNLFSRPDGVNTGWDENKNESNIGVRSETLVSKLRR
jgi:hypothetical protein